MLGGMGEPLPLPGDPSRGGEHMSEGDGRFSLAQQPGQG